MQRFMNLPCWLLVICWYRFILYFQKVVYIILIHYLAKYYLAFLINCQTQLPRHNQKPRREKIYVWLITWEVIKNHVLKSRRWASGFSTDMWRACKLSLPSLQYEKAKQMKIKGFYCIHTRIKVTGKLPSQIVKRQTHWETQLRFSFYLKEMLLKHLVEALEWSLSWIVRNWACTHVKVRNS